MISIARYAYNKMKIMLWRHATACAWDQARGRDKVGNRGMCAAAEHGTARGRRTAGTVLPCFCAAYKGIGVWRKMLVLLLCRLSPAGPKDLGVRELSLA